MKKTIVLLLAGYLFSPVSVLAAVVISEVAWMGDDESANNEWIELHNTGSNTVNLEGWSLSDGMGLDIELSGVIKGGDYEVLERTDDDSALGGALLIYTGALTNTGATLSLYRSDGGLEDRVVGGDGWENIGGDNVTKETAQLLNSGWSTAIATPGKPNQNISSSPDDTEGEEDSGETNYSTKSTNKTNKDATPLSLPEGDLGLAIEANKLGYVNQPINFSVRAEDVVKVVKESLNYHWNFGDLGTGIGENVSHAYAYPGTYVVTVYGEFSYHEAVAKKEITILPVQFSITRNLDGDVQVSSNSQYEIDVSGYTLSGTKSIKFPPYSVIGPMGTITVPKEKFEDKVISLVALYDNKGELVASTFYMYDDEREVVSGAVIEAGASITAPPAKPIPTITDTAARTTNFVFRDDTFPESISSESETILVNENPEVKNLASAVTAESDKELWVYFALLLLIALGVSGIHLGNRNKVNSKPFPFSSNE